MDIYKNSFEYAKENGEIEQYRENLRQHRAINKVLSSKA